MSNRSSFHDLPGVGGMGPSTPGQIPTGQHAQTVSLPNNPGQLREGRRRRRRYMNVKGTEIIGLKTATLRHQTLADSTGNLTQSTLDTSSYATGAVIQFNNATGNSQVVVNCALLGKYVVRLSGSNGYVHDEFVDYESIAVDGEILFELGNNFVVAKEQVEKLADFWWKYQRGGKHVYTIDRPGTWFHITPGQWYTLQIGGAGQKEYIDATVQCMDVTTDRGAGGLGSTRMVFREVEQNWTFDSNAVARFIAAGLPARSIEGESVMVADEGYCGMIDAFSYCDGTADEVEINAAIDYVAAQGGGVVKLTKGGTFYVTAAAIELKSGVYLDLNGATIEKNVADYAIEAVGTLGSEIENCGILGPGTITRNAADTNQKLLVYFDYVTNGTMSGCVVKGSDSQGFYCENSSVNASENVFIDNVSTAINVNISSGIVRGNEIYDTKAHATATAHGILVQTSPNAIIEANNIHDLNASYVTGIHVYGSSRSMVMGNSIADLAGRYDGAATYGAQGIRISSGSDNVTIAGNRVYNVWSWDVSTGCTGIVIQDAASENAQIKNNTCIDNGNLIDRGNCESATAPLFAGETVPLAPTNATWVRSAVDPYEGTYCWLFTKTSAAAGGSATEYLCDATATNDMHGLVAGLEYAVFYHGKVPVAGTISRYSFVFQEYHTTDWHVLGTLEMSGAAAWEEVTDSFTLNADTTGVRMYVYINTDEVANSLFRLDNLRIQPKGIGNDHTQQYGDAGDGTYDFGNSWQGP